MPAKPNKFVWLAPLGQTIYENLNPFWLYCQSDHPKPARIVLLHALEMAGVNETVKRVFTCVADAYCGKNPPQMDSVAFDDENVSDFNAKIKTAVETAVAQKERLVVDVSPTTWSYVPILLMKMAQSHGKHIQSVLYLQYDQHRYRQTPQPLIPRLGLQLHDLWIEQG